MEMRHFAPSPAAKLFGTAADEGANCWMMSDRDDGEGYRTIVKQWGCVGRVTLGPHDVGTHAQIV